MSLAISSSSSSASASSSSRRRWKIVLMPSLSRAELRERPARSRPNQPRRSSRVPASLGVAAAGGSGCGCGSSPESCGCRGWLPKRLLCFDRRGRHRLGLRRGFGRNIAPPEPHLPGAPRPALQRPAPRRGCSRCYRSAASAAPTRLGGVLKADFGVKLGAPAAGALDQHLGLAADRAPSARRREPLRRPPAAAPRAP